MSDHPPIESQIDILKRHLFDDWSPIRARKALEEIASLQPSPERVFCDRCAEEIIVANGGQDASTPDLVGLVERLKRELDLHDSVMPPSVMEQIIRQHFGEKP